MVQKSVLIDGTKIRKNEDTNERRIPWKQVFVNKEGNRSRGEGR